MEQLIKFKNKIPTIKWYSWLFLWMFPTYTTIDGNHYTKVKKVFGAIYVIKEGKLNINIGVDLATKDLKGNNNEN